MSFPSSVGTVPPVAKRLCPGMRSELDADGDEGDGSINDVEAAGKEPDASMMVLENDSSEDADEDDHPDNERAGMLSSLFARLLGSLPTSK